MFAGHDLFVTFEGRQREEDEAGHGDGQGHDYAAGQTEVHEGIAERHDEQQVQGNEDGDSSHLEIRNEVSHGEKHERDADHTEENQGKSRFELERERLIGSGRDDA